MMNAGKIIKNIAVSAALLSLYAGSAVSTYAASLVSPFSNTVSDTELDKDRGAFAPAISNQAISDITASVTGGTDIGTISGMNDMNVSGISGLGTFINNSGNNVSIQSAITANVTFVNSTAAR